MTLWLPKPVAGPAEEAQADHAICAKLATNAILAELHAPPVFVVDNGTAYDIANAVNALGIATLHAEAVYNVAWPQVSQRMFSLGQYAVFGVWCNGNAQPVPESEATANHWLAPFSSAGDCYQCWTATYPRYDLSGTHNPQMGTVFIWDDDNPLTVTNDQPPAPPQGDDNDMGSPLSPPIVRATGQVDLYELNEQGDLWHKWFDSVADMRAGKERGNERIGYDGSTNQNRGTGLDYTAGIRVTYASGVTTILGIVGQGGNAGREWVISQTDGGSTWAAVDEP